MCPARAARPASPRFSSYRRTRRRSGRARARSRPINPSARILQDYPDGSAERIARGDRTRLRARPGPHRLRRRLRRSVESAGARLSRRRRRSDPHHARLSGLSDRHAGRPAHEPVVAAETDLHRRRRCDPRGSDEEDQNRLPRQSEQSDRHLHFVRRGQAAAIAGCRRMCCSCSTPLTPNTCSATTTSPASSWSPPATMSSCRRTFSKIHGLAALRLGWMFGPAHVVAAINRIRGPFNVNAPAIAAGVAAIEDFEHQERSRRTQHALARLADAGDRASSASK